MRGPSSLRRAVGLFGAAILTPAVVEAHLVSTGLGPFYDGISHLVLTPEDLLPLVALALLAGLRGAASARGVLFVLPAVWFLAGLAGLPRTAEVLLPLEAAIWVLATGALVALDRRVPQGVVLVLAVAFATVHGYLNGTAMGAAGLGVRGLLGIASAAFVLVALMAALAVPLRAGWPRVAVRVAGSWILAAGMFMLGWALR